MGPAPFESGVRRKRVFHLHMGDIRLDGTLAELLWSAQTWIAKHSRKQGRYFRMDDVVSASQSGLPCFSTSVEGLSAALLGLGVLFQLRGGGSLIRSLLPA